MYNNNCDSVNFTIISTILSRTLYGLPTLYILGEALHCYTERSSSTRVS